MLKIIFMILEINYHDFEGYIKKIFYQQIITYLYIIFGT